MPVKQRYTETKIYQVLQAEGYRGSAPGVRCYMTKLQRQKRKPQMFVPLSFDPGIDAQVILSDQKVTVQLFFMRLCSSKRLFMMAFPPRKQESFF